MKWQILAREQSGGWSLNTGSRCVAIFFGLDWNGIRSSGSWIGWMWQVALADLLLIKNDSSCIKKKKKIGNEHLNITIVVNKLSLTPVARRSTLVMERTIPAFQLRPSAMLFKLKSSVWAWYSVSGRWKMCRRGAQAWRCSVGLVQHSWICLGLMERLEFSG